MNIIEGIASLFSDDSPAAIAESRAESIQVNESGATVKRQYAAAKNSRLTSNWATQTTSADAQIRSSLDALRGRCRQLERDSAYAKRAKKVVVDNVIGVGIGLKGNVTSTRNKPIITVNRGLETAWRNWWTDGRKCHTGGELAAGELERLVMGQVFDAGEVFIRMHKRKFGDSEIPFALEVIESERVPHGVATDLTRNSNAIRMGIEVDKYYRPAGYWLRDYHPNEFSYPGRTNKQNNLEYVPADEMIHLRILDRWPQTRGVPWLHAVAKKINDMEGYTEAEIVAARGAANYMGSIEQDPMSDLGDVQDDGTSEIEVAPGIVMRLNPGEKFEFHSPNRPNTALDGFMRYMLRECAAGVNVSYESLSRDYSQSNYSSSRLSLLEDRDAWRVLQSWFILKFRTRVFNEWLNQAVLSRNVPGITLQQYANDPAKFKSVRFKPRGWGWVDPTKEVKAYREAEEAGYTTKTQIIAETSGGRDIEDVLDERQYELELIDEKGLEFATSNKPAAADPETANTDAAEDDDSADDENDDEDSKMRVIK